MTMNVLLLQSNSFYTKKNTKLAIYKHKKFLHSVFMFTYKKNLLYKHRRKFQAFIYIVIIFKNISCNNSVIYKSSFMFNQTLLKLLKIKFLF